MPKKKNPTDATLRNVKASRKSEQALSARLSKLEAAHDETRLLVKLLSDIVLYTEHLRPREPRRRRITMLRKFAEKKSAV